MMHGAYERLLTVTIDGQDIELSEINLDNLPLNLRFSSEKIPWARSIVNGDFILIAEFAENEGPKPVVSQI